MRSGDMTGSSDLPNMTAGANSTRRSTRPAKRAAARMASVPPRLDPIKVAGPRSLASSASNCSSIRVIVRALKSGSLKSGQRNAIPSAANFCAKYAPLVERAEEAKPCRNNTRWGGDN